LYAQLEARKSQTGMLPYFITSAAIALRMQKKKKGKSNINHSEVFAKTASKFDQKYIRQYKVASVNWKSTDFIEKRLDDRQDSLQSQKDSTSTV
jgi:hypothetical protein